MGRIKGFGTVAVAFAAGVVIGSAGVAGAAFGKKGWERFGPMFKQGYVAGFIDAVRIAKSLEPYSYMATQYPVPPNTKPLDWMMAVDEVYKNEQHANRPMSQVLVIAGHKLETRFGSETKHSQAQQLGRLQEAIEKQRRALASQREGIAAAREEIEKSAEEPEPGAAEEEKAARKHGKKSGGAAASPGAAQETPPKPESAAPGAAVEGSHGEGMLPEGSRPDAPLKHPQADPDAPHTGGEQ